VQIRIHAQTSANENITFFDEKFSVSLLGNYNICSFNDFNSSKYETVRPFDIGFGFRYKNISAQLSIPTAFDEKFNIWSFDFEIDSYFNSVYYEAYFKSYPQLYVENSDKKGGLSVHSSGVMATLLQNNENHFLSSVIKLDKKQNISSGSLLYGFGISHSSIYSIDQALEDFRSIQHFLYFGPSIGYSYIWVFKNDIFLNTSLVFFTNVGVNITNNNFIFIPQLEPKIVVGHHNKTWSVNLKMMDHAKFMVWDKDGVDILTLISITIMFSKRF